MVVVNHQAIINCVTQEEYDKTLVYLNAQKTAYPSLNFTTKPAQKSFTVLWSDPNWNGYLNI